MSKFSELFSPDIYTNDLERLEDTLRYYLNNVYYR
jgi:hypothetical protein